MLDEQGRAEDFSLGAIKTEDGPRAGVGFQVDPCTGRAARGPGPKFCQTKRAGPGWAGLKIRLAVTGRAAHYRPGQARCIEMSDIKQS